MRLNDAIANLAGDILTDTQPFTIVYINNAWRRLQELLVNYGQAWFKPEVILTNLAGVAIGADPGTQVTISWTSAPPLPQNLIAPLILWERAAGNGSFFPMDRLDNGLPAVPKLSFNKVWEWRNGQIYVPGATQSTDVRMRYAAFFPEFVPAGTAAFNTQLIPIVWAYNPLAWFICAEVAKARGDMDSQEFEKQAMQAVKFMFDLDPMQARSVRNEAEYAQMTDRNSATQGPAGPRGMGAA